MTLIIGIRCSDGVVVGADGAVTFGTIGHATIIQPSSKLYTLPGNIILGVSGAIGIGQQVTEEVTRLYDANGLSGRTPVEVGRAIGLAMWERVFKLRFEAAAVTGRVLGSAAAQDALCATLVALPVGERAELMQVNYEGLAEVQTAQLPFVSIGSGQEIADPFLAFLRRVYFRDAPPSTDLATLCVLWTLSHATDCHPGGVAKPITIVRLSREEGKWVTRTLGGPDLAEHHAHIAAAEKSLPALLGPRTPVPQIPSADDSVGTEPSPPAETVPVEAVAPK